MDVVRVLSPVLFDLSLLTIGGRVACAQSLTVLPVSIVMEPGQSATTVKVINGDAVQTSVQARVLAWTQRGDEDALTSTDELMVSPPIATIAPGATQVVRLVLRHAPQGGEATYRILLDQIPPAAAPGIVRIALRLSMPVFAKPSVRVAPHVVYQIERKDGQAYLVAQNEGASHDSLREFGLSTDAGVKVKTVTKGSPYILAGARRRWLIVDADTVPPPGGALRLTGKSESGPVDQEVRVAAAP